MIKFLNSTIEALLRFCVYTLKLVGPNNEVIERRQIVLRDADNLIVACTGLEVFSHEYTGQEPKIQNRRQDELHYICKALNYFFENGSVSRICDISREMIIAYFDVYCTTPKADGTLLSKRSVHNCIRTVSYFFANLASKYPMKFSPDDLLRIEYIRKNKDSTKVTQKYIPAYVPSRNHPSDAVIPRDIPLRVVQRLIDLAYIYDPMIAFAIVAQTAAGLRGACPMNMRQVDSPVSATPGLTITYMGTGVSHITIDLTHEYVLRPDGVSVGHIKKKRRVDVYPGFMAEFSAAYQYHLQLLKQHPVDDRYKPMFVNNRGSAMTYATYRERLHKLIGNHLVPELLRSANPEDVAIGMALSIRKISPHVFRHVFSVRLVFEGLDVAQIMHYRGDTSPESALTYLANKGELIKLLTNTHHNVIDGLSKGGVILYDPTSSADST